VTALIKPLDEGVTATMRRHYRGCLLQKHVDETNYLSLEYDKASYHYIVIERIVSDHKIYCSMRILEVDISAAILQHTESREIIDSENTQTVLMLS
jgi:hypothetical protein